MNRHIQVLLAGVFALFTPQSLSVAIESHMRGEIAVIPWQMPCVTDEMFDKRKFQASVGYSEIGLGGASKDVSIFDDNHTVQIQSTWDSTIGSFSMGYVRVDKNNPIATTSCFLHTCSFFGNIATELISQMKTGSSILVRLVNSNGQKTDFRFPLDGFATAYEQMEREPSAHANVEKSGQ